MSFVPSPHRQPSPLLDDSLRCCPRRFGLHPSVWLILWFSAVVAQAGLPWPLSLWTLAALVLLLIGLRATAFLTLCRRSRFLLAITAIVLAWRTPGRAIVEIDDGFWAALIPTAEGLSQAGVQLANLLIFLALTALCLTLLTPLQWAVGLYRLARCLPGVDAERFAVRVMLVLDALGVQTPPPLTQYHRLFDDADRDDPNDGSGEILLQEPRIGFRDVAVGLIGLALPVLLWQLS